MKRKTTHDSENRRLGSYDPHFFQPLLPGFRRRLKIPEEFMNTYLDEELSKKKKKVCESNYATLPVLLRSHTREWVVHLGGRNLQKGWPKFIDQYFDVDLDDDDDGMKMDVGDIIVFKHKGDLIFDVSVFDGVTGCQKLPKHNIQDDDHQSPLINNSNKNKRKKEKMISSAPKKEECSRLYNRKKRKTAETTSVWPYFDSEINLNTNIEKKTLYVPIRFVKENGLKKSCDMILEDDRGRRWEVKGKYYQTKSHLYITKGWNEFQTGNGLKLNDCFRFHLVRNAPIPRLLFSRLPKRKRRKKKDGDNDMRKKKKDGGDDMRKKKKDGDDDRTKKKDGDSDMRKKKKDCDDDMRKKKDGDDDMKKKKKDCDDDMRKKKKDGDDDRTKKKDGDNDMRKKKKDGDNDMRRKKKKDGDDDRTKKKKDGDNDMRKKKKDGDNDMRRKKKKDGDDDRTKKKDGDDDRTKKKDGDNDMKRKKKDCDDDMRKKKRKIVMI